MPLVGCRLGAQLPGLPKRGQIFNFLQIFLGGSSTIKRLHRGTASP